MRLRLSSILLYSTLLALLVGGGVVNGLVNARWSSAAEEPPQLDRLPRTIGDWNGVAIEADPNEFPAEQSGNMLLRRYVRRSDGAAVIVFLTAGRAGPMVSAHLPDSCYPGAGYQFAAPMTKRSISTGSEGGKQEFRTADFSKTERAMPVHVRVHWAWSADRKWSVPDYPKLTFAGKRWLYKLYVIRSLNRSNEPVNGDVAESFLQVLTSEMADVFSTSPTEQLKSGSVK